MVRSARSASGNRALGLADVSESARDATKVTTAETPRHKKGTHVSGGSKLFQRIVGRLLLAYVELDTHQNEIQLTNAACLSGL